MTSAAEGHTDLPHVQSSHMLDASTALTVMQPHVPCTATDLLCRVFAKIEALLSSLPALLPTNKQLPTTNHHRPYINW